MGKKRDIGGWDDPMDDFIKKKIMEEADLYEEQLNSDPKLADIAPPPELFDKIMAQIDELDVEKEPAKESEEESEVRDESDADEMREAVYLSEEDRKALELGRRVMKRKPYKKVLRAVGLVAIICVFAFALSMVSEANRVRVMQVWNAVTGQEATIRLHNDGEGELKNTSLKEKIARENIEKTLGIAVPQFMYYPEHVKFYDYYMEVNIGEASIYYREDEADAIFSIYMLKADRKIDYGEIVDGIVVETFSIDTFIGSMDVMQIENQENPRYIIKFIFDGCYYRIYSGLSKDELIKMVESMNIFEVTS